VSVFSFAPMLPDFPDIKNQISPILMNYLNRRVRFHLGFFGEIPMVPIPEGSFTKLVRADGTCDDTPLEKAQGKISVDTTPNGGLSFEAVLKSIDDVAQQMALQEKQMLFRRINQVTEETGNVIDARNQPLSAKLLNDSLEMMHIEFSDDGKPHLPSLVVHPDVAQRLMEHKETEEDVIEKERQDQIIARKREEFFARESRRKLVG